MPKSLTKEERKHKFAIRVDHIISKWFRDIQSNSTLENGIIDFVIRYHGLDYVLYSLASLPTLSPH